MPGTGVASRVVEFTHHAECHPEENEAQDDFKQQDDLSTLHLLPDLHACFTPKTTTDPVRQAITKSKDQAIT